MSHQTIDQTIDQTITQSLGLIDTHCHLDFSEFDQDREQILTSCSNNGVDHIVVPSVSQQHFNRTIECCASRDNLHLALGLHPVFIKQHQPQHLIELDAAIKQNSERIVAVGEIGLDFYKQDGKRNDFDRKKAEQEKQIAFFAKQLIIAKQHGLPVIIHNRKAHDLCINLLAEQKVKSGIIHAFNGSIQQALKYKDLGFKLGFGGMLTYPHSSKLRNLARQIPLDTIVLETDSPDMTVVQHKGKRNSPAYLPYVLASLAEIRNEPAELIARQTSINAQTALAMSV